MKTIENTMHSVVVPVYNGAIFLEELFSRTKTVFEKNNSSFEIIFVDDNSEDGSWDVIKNLNEIYPGIVSGIRLSRNFGQHSATLCGFFHAKGNLIITMDDDLQHPPEEIPKLIAEQNTTGADIVYGINSHQKKSLWRMAGSRIMKKGAQTVKNGKGEGSSFRLLISDLVKSLAKNENRFVYIEDMIYWYTTNISFAQVEWSNGKDKKSRYSLGSLFTLSHDIIIGYSSTPIRMMTWGGFIFSVISFMIGLYFLLKKILLKIEVSGFTALMVSVMFSSSFILFSIGVIGDYLRRIYLLMNDRPQYSIKEKI